MKPSRKGRRGKVTKLQSAKKLPPKLDQAQTFLTSFFSSSSEEPFVAQTPQTRLRQYVPLATPVVYTNDTNVQTPSRLIKPPSLGRLYPLVSSSPTKLYVRTSPANVDKHLIFVRHNQHKRTHRSRDSIRIKVRQAQRRFLRYSRTTSALEHWSRSDHRLSYPYFERTEVLALSSLVR
jgi:hypothetical protein